MAGFVERFPEIVSPNPGGSADPLGESVYNPQNPALRVFESGDQRLVIGRGQDPCRELQVEAAQADGVPIHRRVSGGGAVILAPGTVVVARRLPKQGGDSDCYFAQMNAVFIPVVESLTGVTVACRGHGDLAVIESGQSDRKILGASLRQSVDQVVYLGVFMVTDQVPLMRRYLQAPSRQPAYRADRGHAAFCTHLGRFGVTPRALVEALQAGFASTE